jgi:hypothetical protein
MEDILAIAIVVAGVAFVILAVRKIQKRNAEKAQKEAELELELARMRKQRERSMLHAVANTSAVPPRGKETTVKYTPTYTPTPTQSVKSDDRFMDDMMTAVVINTLLHSDKDSISGTVTKNLDTNEVTFKDSGPSYRDSSPSYSDSSPSSSWSSSSDSSSSWSSSDSSPSSSWD